MAIVTRTPSSDELQKRYELLEQDWACFTQSNPQRLRRRSGISSTPNFPDRSREWRGDFDLMLLQDPSPSDQLKLGTNYLSVSSIEEERREEEMSKMFKGKLLFEDAEGEIEVRSGGMKDVSCACSSVLIKSCAVRSSPSSYDDSDTEDEVECEVCKRMRMNEILLLQRAQEESKARLMMKRIDKSDARAILSWCSWIVICLTLFFLTVVYIGSLDQPEVIILRPT